MSGRYVRRALAKFVNTLFAPGLCLACGCELSGTGALCECCSQRLALVPNPCRYCGQPNPVAGSVCPPCLLNPPRWQRLIAPLQYRGLTRDYLQQFKYSEALHLVRPLAGRCFESFHRFESRPEVLLPVPLHRRRLLERGFNQAEEIAIQWSRESAIPLDRRALTRLQSTPSQAGLSAVQREKNVRGVFSFDNRRGYHHVAIVDDIVTTGSTVGEITRVLHRGGVEFVEVWALARAYRE
ncbi:MAG: ComF family protein [Gammaproteobacteria bacterium]|nr:MAG: ComF family protein [Gammaproteobacteria bacterium]UCH38650.1 MAG: ComF family protein [Gammaproteobacteria bacterium]